MDRFEANEQHYKELDYQNLKAALFDDEKGWNLVFNFRKPLENSIALLCQSRGRILHCHELAVLGLIPPIQKYPTSVYSVLYLNDISAIWLVIRRERRRGKNAKRKSPISVGIQYISLYTDIKKLKNK